MIKHTAPRIDTASLPAGTALPTAVEGAAPARPANFAAYLATTHGSALVAAGGAFPRIPAPDSAEFIPAVLAAATVAGSLPTVRKLDPKGRDVAMASEAAHRMNSQGFRPFGPYAVGAPVYGNNSPKHAGESYWTGSAFARLLTDVRAAAAAMEAAE